MTPHQAADLFDTYARERLAVLDQRFRELMAEANDLRHEARYLNTLRMATIAITGETLPAQVGTGPLFDGDQDPNGPNGVLGGLT